MNDLKSSVSFVIIFLLLFAGFSFFVNNMIIATCGDGTFDGQCSVRKPYFCAEGKLVENSSRCGCPADFSASGESCFSLYMKEPKTISLNYIIRGENKSINFTTYRGMAEYLSEIPREISYDNGEEVSRTDFEIRKINDEQQREFLLPLVIHIQNSASDKTEQMRIAVSIVQKIPYGNSDKKANFFGAALAYSRYPYETLYDNMGVCEEKTELLAFILRELGYGVVLFYHPFENHQSLGIKCPAPYDYRDTGYCFVETTGGSIISDTEIEYTEVGKLLSEPEAMFISEGNSLGFNLYEYKDAEEMIKIRRAMEKTGKLSFFRHRKLEKLRVKYGLEEIYNAP